MWKEVDVIEWMKMTWRCTKPYSNVSSGTPKRGTTSRLTEAGSLLPPVYSESWAKGNAEVSPVHQYPPYERSVGQSERK
ncbi:hypothetical protein TNCV_761721 [Trichonephila clavipes]|nr:hypothetical protein TNCV_761721 [Trichonephila clavipes]